MPTKIDEIRREALEENANGINIEDGDPIIRLANQRDTLLDYIDKLERAIRLHSWQIEATNDPESFRVIGRRLKGVLEDTDHERD